MNSTTRLEFTQKELLDRWNIDFALLTGPPTFYTYAGLPDPDWAARPLHRLQRLDD